MRRYKKTESSFKKAVRGKGKWGEETQAKEVGQGKVRGKSH